MKLYVHDVSHIYKNQRYMFYRYHNSMQRGNPLIVKSYGPLYYRYDKPIDTIRIISPSLTTQTTFEFDLEDHTKIVNFINYLESHEYYNHECYIIDNKILQYEVYFDNKDDAIKFKLGFL